MKSQKSLSASRDRNFSIAHLWWKQLLSELGSTATTRTAGVAGQLAEIRCRTLRHLFFKLLAESKCGTLLEIGANKAEASRRFAQMHPANIALAYEPVPKTFQKLVASDLPTNVVPINEAVGLAVGEAKMFVPLDDNMDIWSSTKQRLDSKISQSEVVVPMTTLNEIGKSRKLLKGKRNVGLWIDVEGAVMDVLAGGESLLSTAAGVVFIEVYDQNVFDGGGSTHDVLALLLHHGFIPVARDNQYQNAYNLLLLHEDLFESCRSEITTWEYWFALKRDTLLAAAESARRADVSA